jgi:hypothetical protein
MALHKQFSQAFEGIGMTVLRTLAGAGELATFLFPSWF